MSNQSIIEHKANMYYVEFREDYLQIALDCKFKKPPTPSKKSKASQHCKALILAIMEHWTNDKRSKGEGLWIFMSYTQWIASMYHMFGRTVVIDSIDELLGEELIFRKAYKMYSRESWQYMLNTQEINRRMRALPDRNPQELEPQIDPVTSNQHPVTNRQVAVTSNHVAVTSNHVAVTSNHNIESSLESNTESNIEEVSASADSAPSLSQKNESSSSDTKPEKENTKPKKPKDNSKQQEIDRLYLLFDAIYTELYEETHKVGRCKKNTEAIQTLISMNASDERIRFVLKDIWNDPDKFWQSNRTISSVASQYSTRAYKMRTPSVAASNDVKPRPTALVSEEQSAKNKARMYERAEAKRQELIAQGKPLPASLAPIPKVAIGE